MMAELFAQDGGVGLSPLVQSQMGQFGQPQQRRPQQIRRPGSMNAQPASRSIMPGAQGTPASAGTDAMYSSFNAASGGPYATQRQSGLFDPSLWNTGLPSGSLTGV